MSFPSMHGMVKALVEVALARTATMGWAGVDRQQTRAVDSLRGGLTFGASKPMLVHVNVKPPQLTDAPDGALTDAMHRQHTVMAPSPHKAHAREPSPPRPRRQWQAGA